MSLVAIQERCVIKVRKHTAKKRPLGLGESAGRASQA